MKVIHSLIHLGDYIQNNDAKINHLLSKAYQHNKWFTNENSKRALSSIVNEFLNEDKLNSFIAKYDKQQKAYPIKTVGIVAAGNIPLVGFHDLLVVLLSNHKLAIKLSEKDNILLPFLIQQLLLFNPDLEERIEIVDRLVDFDAVIATGSDNTARYFEYYFGKYPSVIRKNRNSIAILDGSETKEDLIKLGDDVFSYFGLGCRNVSKLYVPKNYDFQPLKEAFETYKNVGDHYHYKNNLDYNRTILLMNKVPFLNIDFVNVVEDNAIASAISNLHYEYYNDLKDLEPIIEDNKHKLQCVVGNQSNLTTVGFGESQQPTLSDFADNVDTMEFLLNL